MNKEKALSIVYDLAVSEEPCISYKIRVNVLDEDPESSSMRKLQSQIKNSPQILSLMKDQYPENQESTIHSMYKKWTGDHWLLSNLADLNYPQEDGNLKPILDRVLNGWLSPAFTNQIHFDRTPPYHKIKEAVPIVQGRARRCASQQGNALYSSLKLGFMDERCHQLKELLIHWQWPDGGWNCDKKAEAVHSSFWESLLPLRGLAAFCKVSDSDQVRQAVERAAEIFLQRKLYKRLSDGRIMNAQFTRLRYPNYWRYNILAGLIVLSEAGFLDDPRCDEALDLLESKQLPDGGWPAEDRFYQTTKPDVSGYSRVNWGGVSKRNMNPWVTVDALSVLHRAGRI